jgi:hypothetical protein
LYDDRQACQTPGRPYERANGVARGACQIRKYRSKSVLNEVKDLS